MVLHKQFNRFILAGLLNTLNGYAWILIIQLLTERPLLANILGYGIASFIGYLIHSKFTFRQQPTRRNAAGYFAVLCGCYALNLVILMVSLRFFSAMLAQILAVTTFVTVSYFGQSYFAFSVKRL